MFNFFAHQRPLLNPLINLHISAFGKNSGINSEVKRDTPILVSLFCERKNFKHLHKTLFSLLDQSLKPDKIILWLDNEYEDLTFLPYNITQFVKNGLEIFFVKNISNYTQTIMALKKYNDYIIVTADSNIYYPPNWLKKLYISYIANPENIHTHNAYLIELQDKTITPSSSWKRLNKEACGFNIFPISYGGILYPPNCFKEEVFRNDIFLNNVICNEELWFWAMALINNKKIRIIDNNIRNFATVNFIDSYFDNQIKEKVFDKELSNLLYYYKANIINKLNTLSK